MHIQLTVHDQYAVCFIFSCLDITVLVVYIRCVQVDQVAVLVRLIRFNQCFVFFECVVFAVHVFQKSKFGSTVVELFVAQHTILDK